jgi:pentatricopeptide repeat protein
MPAASTTTSAGCITFAFSGKKPPDEVRPPLSNGRGRPLQRGGSSSSSSGSSSPSSSARRTTQRLSIAERDAIGKSQALTARIGELGWQGRWQDVILALETAESSGQKLYTNNFSAAIAALTRSKQPERALQLSVLMRQRGFKIDVYTYTALIDASSKCGQSQKALEFLNEMHQQGVLPNLKSYTAAIDACSQGGQWQKADELLRTMLAKGITPDVHIFTATIDAHSSTGHWQEAVALLREMVHYNMTPNVKSYTTAIDACSKGGQWQQAVDLFREALAKGIKPNVNIYTAVIDAYSSEGLWQLALKLLREMQQQHIVPNVRTYNCMINACRNGGSWQLAVDLLAELKAAALKPNDITYGSLIDALHIANEQAKAEQRYLEMLQRGLTLSHWSATDEGIIDFHEFTEGMAVVAMRIVLRDIAEQKASVCTSGIRNSASYVHPIADDLHIITGHGTGVGKQGSVLQPAIIALLKQLNIECYVSPSNQGRLIVGNSALQQYAAKAAAEQ